MQLDNTRIAIRERNLLDLFDMSVQVGRLYWKQCLGYSLLGVVPLAVLNHLLVGRLISQWNGGDPADLPRYFWLMGVLIYLEAPLASVFLTAFLGPAVFLEQTSPRQVIREVFRNSVPLFLCLGLLRMIVPAWIALLSVSEFEMNGFVEVFLCGFIFLPVATGVRMFRPFIGEIILLERNPMWSSNAATITIGRRSGHLHSPSAGDLFAQWVGSALIGVVWASLVGISLYTLAGVLLSSFTLRWIHAAIWFPGTLWLLVIFMTVVRFLQYLDLRIRREGWEVELLMKAEALRLAPKAVGR